MRPGAVVFDCDGVLVDSEPHSVIAWLDVLSALNHPDVVSLLLAGPASHVTLMVYEWSGPNDQQVLVPWLFYCV